MVGAGLERLALGVTQKIGARPMNEWTVRRLPAQLACDLASARELVEQLRDRHGKPDRAARAISAKFEDESPLRKRVRNRQPGRRQSSEQRRSVQRSRRADKRALASPVGFDGQQRVDTSAPTGGFRRSRPRSEPAAPLDSFGAVS
jgi:hypothetical protein